jgi:hypothetical protein
MALQTTDACINLRTLSSVLSLQSWETKRYQIIQCTRNYLTRWTDEDSQSSATYILASEEGREEDEPETMEDVMGHAIRNGARDYWEKYQLPM